MKPANFYVWHPSLECYALVRLTADRPTVHWGGTDGRDCDGRLATFGRSFCPHDKLASVKPGRMEGEDPLAIMLPEWSKVSRRQRDYAAEAMGY